MFLVLFSSISSLRKNVTKIACVILLTDCKEKHTYVLNAVLSLKNPFLPKTLQKKDMKNKCKTKISYQRTERCHIEQI